MNEGRDHVHDGWFSSEFFLICSLKSKLICRVTEFHVNFPCAQFGFVFFSYLWHSLSTNQIYQHNKLSLKVWLWLWVWSWNKNTSFSFLFLNIVNLPVENLTKKRRKMKETKNISTNYFNRIIIQQHQTSANNNQFQKYIHRFVLF